MALFRQKWDQGGTRSFEALEHVLIDVSYTRLYRSIALGRPCVRDRAQQIGDMVRGMNYELELCRWLALGLRDRHFSIS